MKNGFSSSTTSADPSRQPLLHRPSEEEDVDGEADSSAKGPTFYDSLQSPAYRTSSAPSSLQPTANPTAATQPKQPKQQQQRNMPIWTIICILSTAFSYGCILTTLFLITLPLECERIHQDHVKIDKSVALGMFVSIAGLTQLISPLVGRLSDTYIPPAVHELGQRLPYLVLGSIVTVIGLFLQTLASFYGFWIKYSAAFFLHMIGLNIMYAMMIAMIPDQVPKHQTGVANGILALELVLGSLFGFQLFHSFLYEKIQNMYGLYTCIVIFSTILTGTHGHDKDAEITAERLERKKKRFNHYTNSQSSEDEESQSPPTMTVTPTSGADAEKSNKGQGSRLLLQYKSSSPKWRKVAKKAAKKATHIVLTPTIILKSMLVDPFVNMDWHTVYQSYTIDRTKYHDFFVVTISRLFYYCGMSVQTFFLYFLKDVIHVTNNPEAAVATLAILGQCSGAITCYPVGLISDTILGGRRKPFVYVACAILSSVTLTLIFATSMHQMVIFCVVLGAANGIYLTMDTSLAVDTLPKDAELEDATSDSDNGSGSAQLLGIWGVAAFLGSALGPMIGGPLLYLFGGQHDSDVSDQDEDTSDDGYSIRGTRLS